MLKNIDIDLLEPPRGESKELPTDGELDEIREYGVTQPVSVRPSKRAGHYEILRGEYIWHAAQMLNIHQIPVWVCREMTDVEAAKIRERHARTKNTNPLEEISKIELMLGDRKKSRQAVAARSDRSISTVNHLLRLRKLPPSVQHMLRRGEIKYGHARPLIALRNEKEIVALATAVGRYRLSVRAIEAIVRNRVRTGTDLSVLIDDAVRKGKSATGTTATSRSSATYSTQDEDAPKDANVRRLEESCSDEIGSPVTIDHTQQGSGELRIRYFDLDDLSRILDLLKGKNDEDY